MSEGPRLLVPGADGRMGPQMQQLPQQQLRPPSVQEVANRLAMDMAGDIGADFVDAWKQIEDWMKENPEEVAKLVPGQRRTLDRVRLVAEFQKMCRTLEEEFRRGEGSGTLVVEHDGEEDPPPIIKGPPSDIDPQVTD